MIEIAARALRMPDRRVFRAGAFALLFIAVPSLYWPTAASLADLWTDRDGNYHWTGWVVALISLWLLARRLRSAETVPPQPGYAHAVMLVPVGLAWLLMYRAAFEVAHQALLPAILWLAIRGVFGREIGRTCLFPIAYLYFGIPVWDALLKPLQFATVHVAGVLVAALGVPARIQGDFVQIPEGTFQIEDGCAGLAFLIVGLMLAALYGEVLRERASIRIRLVSAAVAFAIVSNWIRVVAVILIGHVTNMRHHIVHDHRAFGWVIFAAVMVIFSLVAGRIAAVRTPAARKGGMCAANARRPRPLAGLGVTLLCMSVGPVWAAILAVMPASAIPSPLLRPSATRWSGPAPAGASWKPRFHGATREELGTYRGTAGDVDVYIAAYATQSREGKLLGYFNSLTGTTSAQVAGRSRISAGHRTINEIEMRERPITTDPAGRWLIWYVYRSGDRTFASGVAAQLWYAVTSLFFARESRVVALRADCDPDCAHARALLGRFVDENGWLGMHSEHAALGVAARSATVE